MQPGQGVKGGGGGGWGRGWALGRPKCLYVFICWNSLLCRGSFSGEKARRRGRERSPARFRFPSPQLARAFIPLALFLILPERRKRPLRRRELLEMLVPGVWDFLFMRTRENDPRVAPAPSPRFFYIYINFTFFSFLVPTVLVSNVRNKTKRPKCILIWQTNFHPKK